MNLFRKGNQIVVQFVNNELRESGHELFHHLIMILRSIKPGEVLFNLQGIRDFNSVDLTILLSFINHLSDQGMKTSFSAGPQISRTLQSVKGRQVHTLLARKTG